MWSSHKDLSVEMCSCYLVTLSNSPNGSLECPDHSHTECFAGFPVFCNFWMVSAILLTRQIEFVIQKIWQWWWILYICHTIYNVFYIHLYGSPSFITKDFLLFSSQTTEKYGEPSPLHLWGNSNSPHIFASFGECLIFLKLASFT